VKAGEHQEPICELELELLSGRRRHADALPVVCWIPAYCVREPEQSGARLSSGAGQ
jgi:hypothetical protein